VFLPFLPPPPQMCFFPIMYPSFRDFGVLFFPGVRVPVFPFLDSLGGTPFFFLELFHQQRSSPRIGPLFERGQSVLIGPSFILTRSFRALTNPPDSLLCLLPRRPSLPLGFKTWTVFRGVFSLFFTDSPESPFLFFVVLKSHVQSFRVSSWPPTSLSSHPFFSPCEIPGLSG